MINRDSATDFLNGLSKIIDNIQKQISECRAIISETVAYLSSQHSPESPPANTFAIPHTRTKGKTRITDWSNATPDQVRNGRMNRRASKRPLEPELITALQKHFPNYDAETDTFIKEKTPKKETKAINWSQVDKHSLRAAYHYRKRHNRPIEQSLNQALITTFPGYDAQTQKFTHKRLPHHNKTKATKTTLPETANTLFPLYSIPTTYGHYSLYFNNNGNDNRILVGAAQPYEVCLIDTKTNLAVIRKTINPTKFLLFIINYKTGKVLADVKNGVSIISYNPQTHELYAKKHRDTPMPKWHISANKIVTKVINIPSNLPQIIAGQIKKETILIKDDGHISINPLLILENYDTNDAQNLAFLKILENPTAETIPTPPPAIEPHVTPNKIRHDHTQNLQQSHSTHAVKKETSEIPVYVEYVKSDLHGPYNNVYINGKKVLSNHFNTQLELLIDGTLLGIHGIVTDDKNLPQSPIWLVYDTSAHLRISQHIQKFSGYQVHAKKITERPDGLHMDLSNRSTATLKRDRILKEANNKRFIIQKEKTK